MPLQFDPSPYLQVWQQRQQREAEDAQRPQMANQQILQGLQLMADNRRQQQLLDLQKQTLAGQNEQRLFERGQTELENQYKYGTPIDPNVSVGMSGGQGQSSLFGNKPMNVGTGSSLIEQFNKFRAGGMKPAEARPEFMAALGQDERKQFYENANPKEMSEADMELKLARAEYLRRPQQQKPPNFNQENTLRTQFLGQSKDFNDTASSYQRMIDSSREPSAAGDLALIFNYMKMLDPGSTVREGEFANAAASGSYGARFQAAANKILSGERLDDSMRADFINRATDLYQGQLSRHKQREGEFQGLAKSYGGDPTRVTPNLATPIGGYGNQGAQPPQINSQSEYDALPSGAEYIDSDGNKARKR